MREAIAMRNLRIVGGLVLVVLALIVIFQNTEPTTMTFLLWSVQMPRAAALLAAMAIGLVLGMVLSGWRRRRARP
jgi:uncharacterized integral membrane protein